MNEETVIPTRLAIVGEALAAYERLPEQPDTMTRAMGLLAHILGEDKVDLADVYEGEDGDHLMVYLDDMTLRFVEGGTPNDDCYQVSFLGAPVPDLIGVRSKEGLGYALSASLEGISELFDHANAIFECANAMLDEGSLLND